MSLAKPARLPRLRSWKAHPVVANHPVVGAEVVQPQAPGHSSGVPRVAAGIAAALAARCRHGCYNAVAPKGTRKLRRRAAPHDDPVDDKTIEQMIQATAVGFFTGLSVVVLKTCVHFIADIPEIAGLDSEYAWAFPIVGGALISLILVAVGGGSQLEGTALPTIVNLAKSPAQVPSPVSVQDRGQRAIVRAGMAAVTLGTGNSLGPEGPCVELGANVAAFLGRLGQAPSFTMLGLLGSGCAAGVAAGFNAPLAGLIFAIEVVKPPANERPIELVGRMLAATIATAVVQVGLGTSPVITGVDFADFRSSTFSYSELPLFMLLGALGGAASTAFAAVREQAKGLFDGLPSNGIPRGLHPLVASVIVALVAHFGNMPELLYAGFKNVNEVLANAGDLPVVHLLSLLIGKVYLSGLCATSGLVGGVFAPSLFIGASLGALYGQTVDVLATGLGFPGAVSSAPTFAAVGSAAVLASLCGVPITAVVLLLEVAGGVDYQILLPLIAAVGSSVFIESILLRNWLGMSSVSTVQRVSSNPAVQEAEQLFKIIDKNGDGIVTTEELTEWFKDLGGSARSELVRGSKSDKSAPFEELTEWFKDLGGNVRKKLVVEEMGSK